VISCHVALPKQEAVRRIGSDEGLDARRKAYLLQNIMASRYIVAQQARMRGGGRRDGGGANTGGAPAHSYADAAQRVLGCEHYRRGCAAGSLAYLQACCLFWLAGLRHGPTSEHSFPERWLGR
jgi:hypothetical protein